MSNGNSTSEKLVSLESLESGLRRTIKRLGEEMPLIEVRIVSARFPILDTPEEDIELESGTWILARVDTPLLNIRDRSVPVDIGATPIKAREQG